MHTWFNTTILVSSLEDNKLQEITAGAKKVGILRKGTFVFAFAATCPHAGAPLCEGWLDPLGRIVCPLHKYRFDPSNGRNTTGEGYKLFTYRTKIESETIHIELPTL